jgi:hypothetical protein
LVHRTVWCARPGSSSVSFAPFFLNPNLVFLLVCVEPLAPVEYCRCFETGGSLGRRVNVTACPSPDGSSARPSAKGGEQGGRRPARERWESCDLRVRPASRSGALAVGGYKRPRGRGSERLQASAYLVLVPAWPTLSKRALVLPFIGVRRGSRCTMGGVAECYVSSGGELAP